jgi:RNA polymerase-binding transcription factor DksA
MSNTPETDIAEYYIKGEGNYVRSDISRKLERERDEAREENEKLHDIVDRAINYLNQSYRYGFADEIRDLLYEIEQLKEKTK